MALIHRAQLVPGKLDLLATWLPARPWYRGPAGAALTRVTGFRFDDPAGEVGVETMLVRAGDGPLLQVPLTYRAAPLDGAEDRLVGTSMHSVLGKRWVYDGCGDPVYAATLATAILTGGTEAEELVDVDGRLEPRPVGMSVRGSGTAGTAGEVNAVIRVDEADPTLIVTDTVGLAVARVLDDPPAAPSEATLTGSWGGGSAVLAWVH